MVTRTPESFDIVSEKLLTALLRKIVKYGKVDVKFASGNVLKVGEEIDDDSETTMKLKFATNAAQWKMIREREAAIPEMYTNGELFIEKGTIYDLYEILYKGKDSKLASRAFFNGGAGSDTRKLFLDSELYYTDSYYGTTCAGESLEECMMIKNRHIASKLLLTDETEKYSVLEIGCGFGDLSLYIDKMSEANVRGITLSREHLSIARKRRDNTGNVIFQLAHYNQVFTRADRVIYIGNNKGHKSQYIDLFRKISDLLKPNGVALIEIMGRQNSEAMSNGNIGKDKATLAELTKWAEKTGFVVGDVEVFSRYHHEKSIQLWKEKIQDDSNITATAKRKLDSQLAREKAAYKYGENVVYQFQLFKSMVSVPMSRNYISEKEEELKEKEIELGIIPGEIE